MRSTITATAVIVAAIAGCAEQDGSKMSRDTSARRDVEKAQPVRRPDSLLGTWRWSWSYTGERHTLVLHQDGRAERFTDRYKMSGIWHVREDEILEISFTPTAYRLDGDSQLVAVESVPADRDSSWQKIGEIQYSEDYPEGRPDLHPESLVGTWKWSRLPQREYHRLVLHRDGRSVRHRDGHWFSGTWKVREDGMVAVSITMAFRIDSDSELMDIETLSTDRDFPWTKVNEIQNADTQ